MTSNSTILRENLSRLRALDPELEDRILSAPDFEGTLPDRRPSSSERPELPPAPVIVGLGVENWRRIRQILKSRPRSTVILAEPDESRLRSFLGEDRTDLLEAHELLFVAGEQIDRLGDEVEAYFSVASIDDLHVLSPVEEREAAFEAARTNLNRFQQNARTNRATMDRFLTDWYRNFARNLKQYVRSPTLERLGEQYAERTAVVVGPGASLDHRVEQLKSLAGGCVIALDTAVPVLEKLDVTPDFVLAVDTGEQTRAFLRELHPSSVLVAPPYMRPNLVESRRNVLLFETQFPPVNWLKPELSSRGFLAVSGSVATPALDLLRWLKPPECYLVGLDLCYTDYLPYSKRSLGFEQALRKLNRFRTLPGLMLDKMREKELKRIEVDGETLLTSEEFLGWKDALEVILRKLDCPVYRLTDRPLLPLDGTRLTDVVETFHPAPAEEKRLFDRESASSDELHEKCSNFAGTLGDWKVQLEKIKGFQRRERSVRNHWLEFVRSLASEEDMVRYFHWEVDRLTRELQELSEASSNAESLIEDQISRWDTLISETQSGMQRVAQAITPD